ncbi:hypothetical protein Tco_0921490 [Tanacetum coccineum]
MQGPRCLFSHKVVGDKKRRVGRDRSMQWSNLLCEPEFFEKVTLPEESKNPSDIVPFYVDVVHRYHTSSTKLYKGICCTNHLDRQCMRWSHALL